MVKGSRGKRRGRIKGAVDVKKAKRKGVRLGDNKRNRAGRDQE